MKEKRESDNLHSEQWHLLVAINEAQVDYLLYAPSLPNSLTFDHVKGLDGSLQALEDAVYDTSQLLRDYRNVKVMVHSSQFVLLPGDVPDGDCADLLKQAFPASDAETAVCLMPANAVKIAFHMPHGLMAFLERTFNYPEVYHHLFPVCEYVKTLNRGDSIAQMFLNVGDEEMDMVIYREGRLQCANTFPLAGADDVAYFVMNAWRAYGMDQLTDELHLLGAGKLRAELTPLLRQFVKFVLPAPFPAAAMRMGRNAVQAPIDLILLEVCE